MSSFVSRWVVLHDHETELDDLDADGVLRDDVIRRWITEARDAYLDQCRELREHQRSGLLVTTRDREIPIGAQLGRPATVTVSTGATEIHPTSFTMAFRVRAIAGDSDVVINATCVVVLEDPKTGEAREISDAIRDELIALEHAARYVN